MAIYNIYLVNQFFSKSVEVVFLLTCSAQVAGGVARERMEWRDQENVFCRYGSWVFDGSSHSATPSNPLTTASKHFTTGQKRCNMVQQFLHCHHQLQVDTACSCFDAQNV